MSVLPRSTLKQQCELFLGKLRYNVLALVPDRADVVLCQNSWELSNDCLVHEEQPLLLSANSVVEVSDQVPTLPVGCDISFCLFVCFLVVVFFFVFFYLSVFVAVEILICGGALATQVILYTLSLRVPRHLLLLSV